MDSDAPTSPFRLPPMDDPFVDDPDGLSSATAPETLVQRARDRLTGEAASTAYAHGPLGVQSGQTHYSDGFALLLSMPQALAVAARPASGPSTVFGPEQQWPLDAPAAETRAPEANRSEANRSEANRSEADRSEADRSAADRPAWVDLVRRVVARCAPETPVDLAVASAIPPVCADAAWAALAVASAQALAGLDADAAPRPSNAHALRNQLLPDLVDALEAASGLPWSIAPLLAAVAGDGNDFILVDTATREHLPVETQARGALEWVVLDPGGTTPRSAAFHRRCREQAEAALATLRTHGFPTLTAFRDLEHRDLERATDVVADALKPLTRGLVTENRRVQKHVAALRRGDWQMTGGLLLMSHAAQRDLFDATPPEADALVEAIESMMLDGFYGACMVDRGGAVLLTGRPTPFATNLRTLADRTGDALRLLRV